VNVLGTQATQEKTMMENHEGMREEMRSSETQSNLQPSLGSQLPQPGKTPASQAAEQEFSEIRRALTGSEPEWCLPKVDRKAKASSPQLDDSAIVRSCSVVIE
jgi:hypothetical protein